MGRAIARYERGGGLAAWVAAPFWVIGRAMVRLLSRRGAGPRAATAYEGAVNNRLTWDWVLTPIRSANQEIRSDHQTLVGRSRELARNDPHARRYLGLLEVNVVGPHGIRLQCRVRQDTMDLDGAAPPPLDRAMNRQIEAAWAEWSRAENCTVDGVLDLIGLQKAVVRGWARDGEALIRRVHGYPNAFGYAVQLLDPDQLDVHYNRAAGDGVNEIRMGVEINAWGRPVAYHFWSSHPNEQERRRRRVRVPAEEVIHYFDQERPGQLRAVPRFATILQTLRMLHGYREAEVVAARTAAAKMGFFKQDPETVEDPNAPASDETLEMEAEPGKLAVLPPGYSFEAWDPDHPTTAFAEFEKAVLRTIATGLDTSYASLTGDLSDTNYSSIRAGLLVERDFYRMRQTDVANRVLRPIYLDWLKWAVTVGQVQVSPLRMGDIRAHVWRARGWPWVDPEKDVRAALLAIEGRLDSRSHIIAEGQGRDFEEVLEELAEEAEIAEFHGIDLPPVVSKAAPEPAQPGASGGAPDIPLAWRAV